MMAFPKILLAGLVGLAALRGARRRPPVEGPRPSSAPTPAPAPAPGVDLVTNWGATPLEFRLLLSVAEKVSGISGAARFLAVVAHAESRFNPNSINQSDDEVDASRRAFDNAAARFPTLLFAESARSFGSGGLFGQLAPYFLWTGADELGEDAPLRFFPPATVFIPKLALLGAIVNLRRLLAYYPVQDLLDARAGWASVDLLTTRRGSALYLAVRQRFRDSAAQLGIDLSKLPRMNAKAWPGIAAVMSALEAS